MLINTRLYKNISATSGVGGIIGAILTGMLVSPTILGKPLEYSLLEQVLIQLKGIVATLVYSGVITLIIALIIDKTVGLRLSDEDEYDGLDLAIHGERIE